MTKEELKKELEKIKELKSNPQEKKHISYTPLELKWQNGILNRLNQDIVIKGEEYFAYRLGTDFKNFDESVKEHYSNRDDIWFICKRDCPEDKITDNLIQCNENKMCVRWGFSINEDSYLKYKWDEYSFRTNVKYNITRNDELFYEGCCGSLEGAYVNAMKIIYEAQNSPADIGTIDWNTNIIGTKVWYCDQPAIIQSVYRGEMYLVPDKEFIKEFKEPESWKGEDWMYWGDYKDGLYVEIWDSRITWFRK